QYRFEDGRRNCPFRHRSPAPRLQELAKIKGRIRFVPAGAQPPQGSPRPEQPQWSGLPRFERARREESRWRKSQGRRQRDPRRCEHGAQRHHEKDRRGYRQFPGPRLRQWWDVMRRSLVLGVGSALPKRRVTNEELARSVDTSDEWIVERTGIKSRY